MIKVNLLNDSTVPEQKKSSGVQTPNVSRVGYAYIAGVAVVVVALGYFWFSSGGAIRKVTIENETLERELKTMQEQQLQFVELERKQQERLEKINVIEKLLESQKGPVKMLNAVIQAIPQNRDIWLTSLAQTNNGVKLQGQTRNPEILPDFMNNLESSGIFTVIDIEQIERRSEISTFSIFCAGQQTQ